jgi:nodulation protein A (NodA)
MGLSQGVDMFYKGDFLKTRIIEEIEISPKIDQEIRDGLCRCFPENTKIFSITRAWNGVSPVFSVLGSNDNNLIAHIGVISRKILINNKEELTIFGLQNVFIIPEFRAKGLLNIIMQKLLIRVKEMRFDYGILFCKPELEKTYSKFYWQRLSNNRMFLLNNESIKTPLPKRHIAMIYPLIHSHFPIGDIDLQGSTW